ncbi:MAG: RluA family pseudouridine synthase [Bacilli bacterium]|jgi:23S rRNA pseudouridine955/2504/2580 synthase|nr:RluA family pseudouridine synthase [Bacilli bacterium]
MTIQITDEDANQRIDKYLKRMLKEAPLSFIYKMFRQKDVKVNGKKATIDYILAPGDTIDLYLKPALLEQFHKEALTRPVKADFKIYYEDKNVLIVEKPKGVLVHSDAREDKYTLHNMVLGYLEEKGEYDPKALNGFVPSPAHRLDRNTSGIVVFGKTLPALQELLVLFRERTLIEKKYILLVRGECAKSGTIDLPLWKDCNLHKVFVKKVEAGGKPALTSYTRTKYYPSGFSLVEAELLTGRTHQLRVHFAAIGHPIVGDEKYGDFALNKEFEKGFSLKSQFLHAAYFAFKKGIPGVLAPLSGMEFTSPLPEKLQGILTELDRL